MQVLPILMEAPEGCGLVQDTMAHTYMAPDGWAQAHSMSLPEDTALVQAGQLPSMQMQKSALSATGCSLFDIDLWMLFILFGRYRTA